MSFPQNQLKASLQVPHLEQYAGPWAMEETAFNAALDLVNRLDISAHVAAQQAQRAQMAGVAGGGDDMYGDPDMSMTQDGICVIDCVGTMTKYGSSFSGGPSTIRLRQRMRQMANDPKCAGIMMRFDSPGGSADGTQDLADDIAAAGNKKPVWAYVDGMACSAAYWAASQCATVVAGAGSVVGSIGTYMVMYDRSAQAAQSGIRAVVVKAGEYKGVGAAGAPVTDSQVADATRFVNEINDLFVEGVAKGRKMKPEEARKLNDGRAHVGAKAKAQGLVDQIGGMDDAMSGLRAAVAKKNAPTAARQEAAATAEPEKKEIISAPAALAGAQTPHKEIAMSEPTTSSAPANEPKAATLKDLKTKFPKATADWREKCQEDNLTMAQASERWTTHLEAENARLAEETQQAKADAKKIGTPTLATGKSDTAPAGGDAKAQLMAIVDQNIKAGMARPRAYSQACKKNPELHQAFLAQHNEMHAETVDKGRA